MARELRLKHDELGTSQTITQIMEERFKREGLDLHRHEVLELEDDWKRKERILKIKTTKYFVM
jgi:hypothetical protein